MDALGLDSRVVDTLVQVLDLLGTFVFGLSGGAAAVRRKLDLFGVLVLSFAAATAGGMLRDVLIGAVPPAAIADWRYLGVSALAGVVTFYGSPTSARWWRVVLVCDALGLALYAVAGATKALHHHLGFLAAALMGMLTGIGGGIVRDVLVSEVPVVFRREIYALAALAGASVVVAGAALQLPRAPVAVAGMLLCFALRLVALRRGWGLPVAGESPERR